MRLHYALIASLFLATPALAQSPADRLQQLEQDVLLLKRQQERARLSGSNASSAPEAAPPGDMSAAQSNVRITALEEEIRSLRGRIEERDFEVQRLAQELEKLKKDVESRLQDLEQSRGAPTIGGDAPVIGDQSSASPVVTGKSDEKPMLSVRDAEPSAPTAPSSSSQQFDTSRDHYNYAFRLLNQNQYEDAAGSFASFAQNYPDDALVGNAYYWQGETYYIRKDYDTAANLFRQGYEAMPKGPKAPDNLLKLGMSLAAVDKAQEACIVLTQVMEKYKTSAANVAAKAQAEHKRNNCA